MKVIKDVNENWLVMEKPQIRGDFVLQFSKDIFVYAEHPEKSLYGLGYYVAVSRNIDDSVLKHIVAPGAGKGVAQAATEFANNVMKGRIFWNSMSWYVTHFTPSINLHPIFIKQIISLVAAELSYMKDQFLIKI